MCNIATWAFAVAYAVALYLLAVGTWGWLGTERDPLSGVFLIPLGLPWNCLIDSFSDGNRALLASLAPALNLVILFSVCSALRRRRNHG